MCGRFALKMLKPDLIAQFDLDECADIQANHNIPPGTDIPVIRFSPDGKRVLHLLRWGLVPHWAKDPTIGARLNNARAESVREKPSFRDAFKRRRCLIPASGFYEWKTEGKAKQPYFISLESGQAMAMGGLWESWKTPDGGILRTVCVVTTAANELMAPIHERMPVIVPPEQWPLWLDGPAEQVADLLQPAATTGLQAWAVTQPLGRSNVGREEARGSADDSRE